MSILPPEERKKIENIWAEIMEKGKRLPTQTQHNKRPLRKGKHRYPSMGRY